MFKKKPNIKPLSSLRSSDRRKIADQIISAFHVQVTKSDNSESERNDQGAITPGIGEIRNSLLPEGSQSARFTTTAGPNLSQVSGTVYVGAHPGQEQRILWIKIDERLVPTVYTLWRHPGLLPLLHTPASVLRKLQGGADLMTPGLTRGPPFPSEATKGSIVAVASLENPSVPKVVGVCEIDISSLQEVQGAKGHAVRGYHWDGDEIWAWTQNGRSGSDAPDRIDGWDPQDVGQCLSQGLEALSTADHDSDTGEGGVSLRNHDQDGAVEQVYNKYVDGVDAISDQEGNLQEQDLSTKEIDDYFLQAFYYGVHYQRETHQETPGRGLSFPISQSLIISHLVLPYLPIWTPAQAASLQMKRTSWKSVRKFVKALDKRQLLKCKDRDGGETVILDIDFDDPVFTDFVPYKLPKRDVTAQLKEGEIDQAAEAVISTRDDSIGQRVNVLKLLKPKEQLSPLFEASNASIKALYLAIEVRNVVASYIELEKLTSVTNKRLINLNPFLANTIFDGKSSLDPEIIARGSVPRDALIDRIVDNCLPFFAILRNDDTRETVQAKAGQSPKIQLTYQTRSGNKIVTKISGLEVFHINAQILADELQKACASSTSVGQLMGSSPKNPIMEVIVQGPQKDMVQKALEKRGIHPKWIEVVDKVKGGKHARKT